MVLRGTDPAIVDILAEAIEDITRTEASTKKVIGFLGPPAAAAYIAD